MSYGLARAKLVLDAAKTDAQTLTHSAWRLLTWNTPDTMVQFTESSDVFTCLVPGTYLFQWSIVKSNGDASIRYVYPGVYVNGAVINPTWITNSGGGYLQFRPAIFTVSLAAGDTVAFYAYPTPTGGSFTTYTGALGYNRVRGWHLGGVGPGAYKRSLPSLVAATTAASIGSGSQKIQYDTPAVNTAGFTESSDVFICTIPGAYAVYTRATLDNTTWLRLQVYKNGAAVGSSNFVQRIQSLLTIVQFAVGDTLEFYRYTGASCNLISDSGSGIQVVLI